MPIGIMGIGSGLGFFFGPQYAGWRAEAVGWQRPCMELGLLGMVVGILFLILAKESHGAREVMKEVSHPLGKGMRRKMLAIAAILGCRDFAGIATASLVSIYLQKAHGFDARHTGWVVGAMMLSSMVANPIAPD